MKTFKSNLALIMDYLSVTSKEMCIDLHIDASLISRWRSGERYLRMNGRWLNDIARYLLEHNHLQVDEFLHVACPVEMARGNDIGQVLKRWLSNRDGSCERWTILSQLFMDREAGDFTVTAKRYLFDLFECAYMQMKPSVIHFLCSGDLGYITRDSAYVTSLLTLLDRLFQRGFQLEVVLCSDFRISDVSLVCGQWLAAHLRGYIESFYYDNYIPSKDGIIICIPQEIAIQLSRDSAKPEIQLLTDTNQIENAEKTYQTYRSHSAKRFRYGLWNTRDLLQRDIRIIPDKPVYLFQQLPFFGVSDAREIGSIFSLSQDETNRIETEFAPLFFEPQTKMQLLHALNASAIETALDQRRVLCYPISKILSRHVYLSAKALALQLKKIRKILDENSSYSLLCLGNEEFRKMGMEIAVWGSEIAIVWRDEHIAVCSDYPNVSALQGFCTFEWERCNKETRAMVISRLDNWLRRAHKMRLI